MSKNPVGTCWALILASLLAIGGKAWADGTVSGVCRMQTPLGQSIYYIDLYGWNLYLSKDGGGTDGQSTRVGTSPNPPGGYNLTAPGGTYSMFLDQALTYGRAKIVQNIQLPASGGITKNIEPSTDYVCVYGGSTPSWGDSPWTWYDSAWYQTFVATGTSIHCVAFRLAGTNATQIEITLLAEGPGNVTTWAPIASPRSVSGVISNSDYYVRFRSGDAPTTPSARYAFKLQGTAGTPDTKFAPYRRLEDGQGYTQGQAFASGGQAQAFDLYGMVFCDNDDTIVPYCYRDHENGDLAGWAGRWEQEIQATGTGLAGALLYYFGGDTWDKKITFKVRTGGPDGPQVGPAKVGQGVLEYEPSQSGLVAVSWNRGEVPLTPGQKYYIEMGHPSGFNPAKFTLPGNVYPHGDAYQSGLLLPGVDLHMEAVEYVSLSSIDRSPSLLTPSRARGFDTPNDVFTVRNAGGDTLSYAITDDADWLSVDPVEGSCTTETDIISVIYDTKGLAIGVHTATITIAAPGAANTPQTIAVHLTVTSPPLAPCDFDTDTDVDQEDFGRFQACLTGPGIPQNQPACVGARLDDDDDVDQEDFGVFRDCLSGADALADPSCADW